MRFFDLYHTRHLQELEKKVAQLRRTGGRANPFAPHLEDIEALVAEVGELRLLVAVLYRLLQNKGVASEMEIDSLLTELDAADGRQDGRFDGDPVTGTAVVEPVEAEIPFPDVRSRNGS